MTLASSLGFVRRWWWLLLAGGLLGAASTYAVAVRLPRVYETHATLLVGSSAGAELGPNLGADQVTGTYAELITSTPVLASVSAATGVTFDSSDPALEANPVRDTRFIQLNFRSTDPSQAAAVVNLAATTAIQHVEADRATRAGARVDRLKSDVDQLAGAVAAQTAQLRTAASLPPGPHRDVTLGVLQADLTQTQQDYSAALAALQDARVAQSSAGAALTLTEPAVEPTVPILPRVPVDVFSGAAVAFLLALGIGLLTDVLADRSLSPIEMAQAAGVGLVAGVAQLEDPQAEEGFRALCSALRATFEKPPYGVILVTSAATGEGKTTVAAGLATAFARAGDRVILVDANLRRPRLSEGIPCDPSRGLTVLLTDQTAALAHELQPTGIDGMRLLAAGPPSPMAADLVGSHAMQHRLAEVRDHADLVIVDAPSLEISDPLALLAGGVDGVVLVLDPRRGGARTASRAAEQIRAGGGRVLALIVNQVPGGPARHPRRGTRELTASAQQS